MRVVNGAHHLGLDLGRICIQNELVNERNDMEDAIEDQRGIGEKDGPAEIPRNLSNEQLECHGQEHQKYD